jgi:solute carrier family 38 (sodium-coupled neutral amino acid transporter), member 11
VIRPGTVFAGLGTMSFAFVSQSNSFLVFRSLKAPSIQKWTTVTHISIGKSARP